MAKFPAQKRDHPATEEKISKRMLYGHAAIYRDQKSSDPVGRQLRNLGKAIIGGKIAADFPVLETKPSLVNQHHRIEGHKLTVVGGHIKEQHDEDPKNIDKNYKILSSVKGILNVR